jgi:hypothetical protein
LLDQIVPEIISATRPHLQKVVVVDVRPASHGFHSAATEALPGTVVLTESALLDSTTSATCLLHEALHLKMFDISVSGPLIDSHASDEGRCSRYPVHPPWRPGQAWSIARALGAFHVYTHLRVLESAIRCSGAGSGDGVGTGSRAEERAFFLADALADGTGLTSHGRAFHAWLTSTLPG